MDCCTYDFGRVTEPPVTSAGNDKPMRPKITIPKTNRSFPSSSVMFGSKKFDIVVRSFYRTVLKTREKIRSVRKKILDHTFFIFYMHVLYHVSMWIKTSYTPIHPHIISRSILLTYVYFVCSIQTRITNIIHYMVSDTPSKYISLSSFMFLLFMSSE